MPDGRFNVLFLRTPPHQAQCARPCCRMKAWAESALRVEVRVPLEILEVLTCPLFLYQA